MKNLAGKIKKSFPRDTVRILRMAGKFGDDMGFAVYGVGGFVRDLILGFENLDIDLIVEGDGIAYAGYFAKKQSGTVIPHKRFGTATVFLKSGQRIDVSTAREEYYLHSAALPEVESSSIKNDLLRRDFTINAIAVGLNRRNFGEVVDLFGGEADIRKGIIRILHDLSFEDDPTRIFRAVRFSHRFGFGIERKTRILMRKTIEQSFCKRLSGSRIRNEIKLLFNEKDPAGVIEKMVRLGVLECIHAGLKFNPEKFKLLRRIDKTDIAVDSVCRQETERWLLYLLGILHGFNKNELEVISARLMLSRKERETVMSLIKVEKACKKFGSIKKDIPSFVCRALIGIPPEGLVMVISIANERRVEKLVLKYLSEWSRMKTVIKGNDLLKLGFKPGPEFRRILEKVLFARIDGFLETKQDEIDYVKKHFM